MKSVYRRAGDAQTHTRGHVATPCSVVLVLAAFALLRYGTDRIEVGSTTHFRFEFVDLPILGMFANHADVDLDACVARYMIRLGTHAVFASLVRGLRG